MPEVKADRYFFVSSTEDYRITPLHLVLEDKGAWIVGIHFSAINQAQLHEHGLYLQYRTGIESRTASAFISGDVDHFTRMARAIEIHSKAITVAGHALDASDDELAIELNQFTQLIEDYRKGWLS